MLRLSVGPEEYIQVGEDVRIVFLGGTANHMRIMVDAPKEINIARGKAIESRARARGEEVVRPNYYAAEEHPEKWNRREDAARPKGAGQKDRDTGGNGRSSNRTSQNGGQQGRPGTKKGKTHIVCSAAGQQYPAYHG